MKKAEIVKCLARQAGVSPAEAADHLDSVVRHILEQLRHGREASLPGLGKFTVEPSGRWGFQREGKADS